LIATAPGSATRFDAMAIKTWLLGPLQADLPTPELYGACRRFLSEKPVDV
jgi:hypothetical protein